MLFMIYALDHPTAAPLREQFYPAHKQYLTNAHQSGIQITMAGPLVKDDGTTAIGSLFVIEVESRAQAEQFHHNDPFYKANVWHTSTITTFNRKR